MKPQAKPLTAAKLNDLALAYAARFATTKAKLATYLTRKLRERGWDGDGEPPVAALVEKFAAAGYVDDAAYAGSRASSLLRRGYGARRIGAALDAAGVDKALQNTVQPDAAAAQRAALTMARKRRFGPYGAALPDHAQREIQLAAMLRAGHPLAIARELVNATTLIEAEESEA